MTIYESQLGRQRAFIFHAFLLWVNCRPFRERQDAIVTRGVEVEVLGVLRHVVIPLLFRFFEVVTTRECAPLIAPVYKLGVVQGALVAASGAVLALVHIRREFPIHSKPPTD